MCFTEFYYFCIMHHFPKILKAELKNSYSDSEIRTFGMLILEKITGFSRTQLLVNKEFRLNNEQNQLASQYLERLKNHEPIQYILGETEFCGLKFKVNPGVLIPRPETEELVEWILTDLPPNPLKGEENPPFGGWGGFLDIGTGSGCIAVSLKKKFPSATVSAMDISAEALEVASQNTALNQVDVEFIQDDILNPVPTDRKWEVIVSNPPYIPASEHSEMDRNVTDYEPHLALFVSNDDPLIFYRKIAGFALSHLTTGGHLYFEIHQNLAYECKQLLEEIGFTNVEIRRDLSGNERMVRGELPG